MISKLPGWVFIGGLVLASIAGFVNAVGLLGLNHPVSHMTGVTTDLGVALGHLLRGKRVESRKSRFALIQSPY